jgi:hypothetical protein
MKRIREVVRSYVAILFISAIVAHAQTRNIRPQHRAFQVETPTHKASSVRPEDPIKAVLAAFDRYEVVGMDAAHGNKDLDDLILHLIRNPALPSKVNDVVVECGNSLYQGVLDRYIAGEDVPLSEVRRVWRDTALTMCSVSGFYEMLFPLVRRINQRLTTGKKLRVLAGKPPLDWSKVTKQSEVMLDRDASIASVMEKEVLSKHRRALMLFGTFHLFHNNKYAPRGLESAVHFYEKDYPGVTMVIGSAIVSGEPIEAPANLEARMATWPVPSLIQNIQGTWLADVNRYYFSKMVDAYLYLGPSNLMLAEPQPAEIYMNKDYMTELCRRATIKGNDFTEVQANPVSDQQFSPFLFP